MVWAFFSPGLKSGIVLKKFIPLFAALLLVLSGCAAGPGFTASGSVSCGPTTAGKTTCVIQQAPVTAVPKPVKTPAPKPSPKPVPKPKPPVTPSPTPTATPTPSPTTPPTQPPVVTPPAQGAYPLHTNIVSTSFWVGEIFNASLSDGSQVCSTYDMDWATHWSGVTLGTNSASQADCPGSPWGGCDGKATGTTASTFKCATETRTAANGFEPNSGVLPKENAFYLDLPFDDVNDATAFKERCQVIPWASATNAADGVNHCADANYSYMKNQWVRMTDGSNVCYGQVEDAGPSSGSLYHDAAYVFGTTDARPVNTKFSGDPTQGDGADVSPALNGCLGFKELDGDNDHISWQFVDAGQVPAGPWLTVVTTSGLTE